MKKTGSMVVSVSASAARDSLVMHPNDGFDLGFMRVEHPVPLCLDLGLEAFLKGETAASDPVRLALLNECPPKTMVVGTALHRRLGEPIRVVVLFDGERLFVHGQSH